MNDAENDGDGSSRAGAIESSVWIEPEMVGGSSDALPDTGQFEIARTKAPPSPPPTRTGTVDMLSQVR